MLTIFQIYDNIAVSTGIKAHPVVYSVQQISTWVQSKGVQY